MWQFVFPYGFVYPDEEQKQRRVGLSGSESITRTPSYQISSWLKGKCKLVYWVSQHKIALRHIYRYMLLQILSLLSIPSTFLSGRSGGRAKTTQDMNESTKHGTITSIALNPTRRFKVILNRSALRRDHISMAPSSRGSANHSVMLLDTSHSFDIL